MTDRPILFSAAMVKALLGGRKTQTRRLLTRGNTTVLGSSWRGNSHPWGGLRFAEAVARDKSPMSGCPDPHLAVPFCHPADEPTPSDECGIYAVRPIIEIGDRLWVKETWLPDPSRDDDAWDDWECSPVEFDGCGLKPSMVPPALRHSGSAIFAADPKWTIDGLRWKPSIHMPRWASRLTLTVTDVRVQRLQEISDDDAEAEGCPECPQCHGVGWINSGPDGGWQCTAKGCGDPYVEQYARLWDHINGAGSWEANPFVVAVSFSVTKANIDAARAA